MYDPKAGRWTTQDPIGLDAGDVNLYRYVRNRPVGATDPTGLVAVVGTGDDAKEVGTDYVAKAFENYWKKNVSRQLTAEEERIVAEIVKGVVSSTKRWNYRSDDVLAADVEQRLFIVTAAIVLAKGKHTFIDRTKENNRFAGFPGSENWEDAVPNKGTGQIGITIKQGKNVADGIREFFKPDSMAQLDCAAFANICQLKGFLTVTGQDRFAKLVGNDLLFLGAYAGSSDGTSPALYFKHQQRQERAPIPGDLVVFDNPSVKDDNPYRRENTIYIGKGYNNDGNAYYVGFPIGLKGFAGMIKAIRIASGADQDAKPLDPVYHQVSASEIE